MSAIAIQFAVPRKSALLYLSLALVVYDKIRPINSTVSSAIGPVFVALL